MKKTLLVAALAFGFAGAAQAETSVTLYGIVDAGVGYQQLKIDGIGKATQTGMRNGIQNGNRWGLKGSEDLGNGLKAIFTLESGFNVQDGSPTDDGRLFNRQAYVGLAGDSWGTFTMGRQYNIADGFFGGIPAFGTSFSLAANSNTFGSSSFRIDNLFKYVSPSFSGFQFGLGYSNNNNGSNGGWKIEDANGNTIGTDPTNVLTTGLAYKNGPIRAAVTYDRMGKATGFDEDGNAVTGDGTIQSWNIGGSYDFEVVKLALAFGQDRNGKIGSSQDGGLSTIADQKLAWGTGKYAGGFKSNNFLVSLSAPLGNGTLMAQWATSHSNLDGTGLTRLDDGSAIDSTNQNIYSLGYTYDLSKRTSVYAYGSYAKGLGYIDGSKGQEAGIGMRHKF